MRYLIYSAFFVISGLNAAPISISVFASSAILINANNGKVLFEKQADQKQFPASTTKIATCLLALKKKANLEESVKCSLDCLLKIPQKLKIAHQYQDPPYRLEPDGKSYGIYPGEILSLKDLMYGMMLHSANDASNVIAHHLSGGDISSYLEEVNSYVRSIGCLNTQFYNPHGLHYPKHVSTARDLARLAQEAIQIPEFLEIIQTVNYERPKTNKQPERIVWTSNRLLKKGPFYYPKAFGIKLGYHAAGGGCFVGAAKDEDRVLISVVLHCKNAAEAFKDTIRMFDAAFSEKILTRQLINHEESVFVQVVKEGNGPVHARLKEDLAIQFFPSEEEELKPELCWSFLKAPIKKGDKVGMVHVKNMENKIIKTASIYAIKDVTVVWYYQGYHGLTKVLRQINIYMLIAVLGMWWFLKQWLVTRHRVSL
jgi:D-alanyl-D-alanine carboxypeptidase (penicillin-binding protein 5/6)